MGSFIGRVPLALKDQAFERQLLYSHSITDVFENR